MENPNTIYNLEKRKGRLILTDEQKKTVKNITPGIGEIDEVIREIDMGDVSKERNKTFERKYIARVKKEYEQTLKTFSLENLLDKERLISETYKHLEEKLLAVPNFELGKKQKSILKLKLAHHFQNNEKIDINTLFDAIIETPKFIGASKGSLNRLFEIHEQKTLEKIAEMRKKRAEMKGNETFNPHENLFTTKSGNYYMARLLNMPHLEKESEYMNHCVGTSDSYVNKIKRGEIEILSFRSAPKVDPKNGKTTEEKPLITIEYNPKTKEIEQMKKADDEHLKMNDPYYKDVIDALKQLRTTQTDTGESRDFSKINSTELENIEIKDDYILTEEGKIHFRDFDPNKNIFVLKIGKMKIDENTLKEDATKILHLVENIKVNPEEIAFTKEDINKNTKVYVGEFSTDLLQSNVEHIYSAFPDGKIQKFNIKIGGKTREQLIKEMDENNIYHSSWTDDLIKSGDFMAPKKIGRANLVKLFVMNLGFPNGATTQEIYNKAESLGLELCPAEVGPYLRLQYPGKEWMLIAMKQVVDRHGCPSIFGLYWDGERLGLGGNGAKTQHKWNTASKFIFHFRNKKS